METSAIPDFQPFSFIPTLVSGLDKGAFSADLFIGGAFYILLGIFVIYSVILLYHWLRYGRSYPLIWSMGFVYFGVSIFLLGIMSIAVLNII